MNELRCVVEPADILGEGPVWAATEGRLYWFDIQASCAFGGEGLATLYVTSAREGLSAAASAKQPLAGSLLAFEPGVAGLPLPAFSGELAPP